MDCTIGALRMSVVFAFVPPLAGSGNACVITMASALLMERKRYAAINTSLDAWVEQETYWISMRYEVLIGGKVIPQFPEHCAPLLA